MTPDFRRRDRVLAHREGRVYSHRHDVPRASRQATRDEVKRAVDAIHRQNTVTPARTFNGVGMECAHGVPLLSRCAECQDRRVGDDDDVRKP